MAFSDFDEYQKKAGKTAVYPRVGKNFIYPAVGLMGEVGEIANKIGKIIRDDKEKITPEKREEIKKELGDVLWFVAQLSTEFKIKLSDVAKENLEKLASRKTRGKIQGSGDNR